MGARRRGKGSKARRRAGPPTHAFDLALTSLELARGSDGLFRGEPEPALVVGVYRAHPSGRVALAGRLLARVRPEGGFPACTPIEGHAVSYDTRFSPDEHVVVLAAGVEEDGGEGVAALYERFAAPEGLLAYRLAEAVPSPVTLSALSPILFTPPSASPVELVLGGAHAKEITAGDDYVGAAALSVPTAAGCDEIWRLALADGAGRNDWTLVLRLRIEV